MADAILTDLWAGLGLLKAGPPNRGSARARRRPKTASRARGSLAALDRKTLTDIGIGRGTLRLAIDELGPARLRRPPHV
jgi:hypothetical protein